MALIPRTSKVVKASQSTARKKEGRERAGLRQPTGNIRFLDSLSLSLSLSRIGQAWDPSSQECRDDERPLYVIRTREA